MILKSIEIIIILLSVGWSIASANLKKVVKITRTDTENICHGYLINLRRVIAPASCFHYLNIPETDVKYYEAQVLQEPKNPISVVEIFIHPEYDYQTLNNDIAIAVMNRSVGSAVDYNGHFQLPRLKIGAKCLVITVGANSTTAAEEQRELPNRDMCSQLWRLVPNDKFCVDKPDAVSVICNDVLFGIRSEFSPCAKCETMAYLTIVAQFNSFIQDPAQYFHSTLERYINDV